MYPVVHSTRISWAYSTTTEDNGKGYLTIKECGIEATFCMSALMYPSFDPMIFETPSECAVMYAPAGWPKDYYPDWSGTYLATLPPELTALIFTPRIYRLTEQSGGSNKIIIETPCIRVEYISAVFDISIETLDNSILLGHGPFYLRVARGIYDRISRV